MKSVSQIAEKCPFISFYFIKDNELLSVDHDHCITMINKWISDKRIFFVVGAPVVQAVLN
jgi:hypothetical protein